MKLLKVSLFIIFAVNSIFCQTSKVDSLKISIEKSKKKKNYKTASIGYQILAEEFKRSMELENALNSISESIKLNIQTENDSLLTKDYSLQGGIYYHFQEYSQALRSYEKAIALGEKTNNLYLLGFSYDGYAAVLTRQDNDTKSINYLLKALEIAGTNEFIELELQVLKSLGYAHIKIQNHPKAIEYLKRGLEKSNHHQFDDIEIKCDLLRFLGLSYSRTENLAKATDFNNQALACYQSTGNIMIASDIMNTIGANYLRAEKYEKAIPYFDKLIRVSDSIDSPLGVNFGKINLSSAYINLKKLDNAERLLLEILKDTHDQAFLPKRIEKVVHQNLTELYEINSEYKLGLKHHKKFKHIEDSLNSVSQSDKIAEIDTKYQTEKKEKENLQLKAETAQQVELLAIESKRKWQLGGALLIALIGLGVFTYFYQQNKRQKHAIEKQKNLVETLQKELHHRIKNNLSFIDLFINLAKSKFSNEAYQTKLNELQNRINSMFEVHKQLFKKDDVTKIKTLNYINVLVKNVERSFNIKNITIEKDIEENETLLADTSFPIGIIVNEFLTNSYKYAFSSKEGGVVNIYLKDIGDAYHLKLKDNGKGLPKDFDINKLDSFGMETMQLLAQEYNGTFELNGANGVTMNITLPKTAA